jgi:hypothetical protein
VEARVRPLEPKIMVNPRLLELQTAKQILEEIFHARPSDVDEMLLMRLEEKSWNERIETSYGRREVPYRRIALKT